MTMVRSRFPPDRGDDISGALRSSLFADRVNVFRSLNLRGRVIAFGGRALGKGRRRKY